MSFLILCSVRLLELERTNTITDLIISLYLKAQMLKISCSTVNQLSPKCLGEVTLGDVLWLSGMEKKGSQNFPASAWSRKYISVVKMTRSYHAQWQTFAWPFVLFIPSFLCLYTFLLDLPLEVSNEHVNSIRCL